MIRKCGQCCITSRLGAITQVLKMLYLNKQCHLEVLATLPELSTKQVRWQDVVAIFYVNIQHKHGKENVVPNALNQKHQIRLVYVGESKQKNIQEASQCDKLAKQMMGICGRESSCISNYRKDCFGTNKIGCMFQREN